MCGGGGDSEAEPCPHQRHVGACPGFLEPSPKEANMPFLNLRDDTPWGYPSLQEALLNVGTNMRSPVLRRGPGIWFSGLRGFSRIQRPDVLGTRRIRRSVPLNYLHLVCQLSRKGSPTDWRTRNQNAHRTRPKSSPWSETSWRAFLEDDPPVPLVRLTGGLNPKP